MHLYNKFSRFSPLIPYLFCLLLYGILSSQQVPLYIRSLSIVIEYLDKSNLKKKRYILPYSVTETDSLMAGKAWQ